MRLVAVEVPDGVAMTDSGPTPLCTIAFSPNHTSGHKYKRKYRHKYNRKYR